MPRKFILNVILGLNHKSFIILFILFSIISFIYILSPIFAQQQQQQGAKINWFDICKHPLVDTMITEPCDTLTSPDGHTLTPKGEHVLGCIGGDTLAVLTGQKELLALKGAVGCDDKNDNASSASTQSNQSKNSYSSCSALHDCLNPKNDPNSINLSNNNTGGIISAFNETGLNGTGNGQFIHPLGIAVDLQGNNVYVVDSGNNRIQKFDSNGKYITQWGFEGSDNQQFNGPHGISVDSDGNVYVTDYNNDRIQKFDSNGKYITQWGTKGSELGQFSSAFDIAISSSKIYVTDTGNNIVQVFTLTQNQNNINDSNNNNNDKNITSSTPLASKAGVSDQI